MLKFKIIVKRGTSTLGSGTIILDPSKIPDRDLTSLDRDNQRIEQVCHRVLQLEQAANTTGLRLHIDLVGGGDL